MVRRRTLRRDITLAHRGGGSGLAQILAAVFWTSRSAVPFCRPNANPVIVRLQITGLLFGEVRQSSV